LKAGQVAIYNAAVRTPTYPAGATQRGGNVRVEGIFSGHVDDPLAGLVRASFTGGYPARRAKKGKV